MTLVLLSMERGGWCNVCLLPSVVIAHCAVSDGTGPQAIVRLRQCQEHEPCAIVSTAPLDDEQTFQNCRCAIEPLIEDT